MRKKYILLLPLLIILSSAKAQLAQSETNASSGSISSENRGNNAMSSICTPDLYTGNVGINIPIYNNSIGGINLCVSLSYNTSGIKVDEIASNVGLGWTLNTGGLITRKVNGIEDEMRYESIDTAVPSGGSNTVVKEQRGSWVHPESLNSDQIDNQPDEFSATFGGKSVTFSIHDYDYTTNTWKIFKSSNSYLHVDVYNGPIPLNSGFWFGGTFLKSRLVPGYTGSIHFKISDENGNQFFFEPIEIHHKHYVYKTFHPTTNINEKYYDVANTWALTRVVTYSGSVVLYEYDDAEVRDYDSYNDQRVLESSKYTDPHYPTVTWSNNDMSAINYAVNFKCYYKKILKITYPNGDVVKFNYDPILRKDIGGSNALKEILIENGYTPSTLNTFAYKFNHAYFHAISSTAELSYPVNSETNTNSLRLKLKSIDKVGIDNVSSENLY